MRNSELSDTDEGTEKEPQATPGVLAQVSGKAFSPRYREGPQER